MPLFSLHKLRLQLTDYGSLLPYAILGVVAGILGALVALSFELMINSLSMIWLHSEGIDNYEGLHWSIRFILILGSAGLIGLVLQKLPGDSIRVGVVHVISRLHTHHGHLPIRNAIVQYIAGAFALACGQSGGREGPEVHLGSAVNSYLGQYLLLPNNSLRILIACGTAAAIAAAFNTPIAGVIFAMEVVIAEYTVAGFLPVIVAAVSATTVTRAISSGGVLMTIPSVEMASLWELPFIAVLGLLAGTAAALFTVVMRRCLDFNDKPLALRISFAGLLCACIAIFVPQIMGIGYDTLNLTFQGQIAPMLLLTIAVCKLLSTAVSCGMGMPVGLIGPSLLIGACLGGALGAWGQEILPELASDPVFYVLLGMVATMGALLNAPLAALLAIVEITRSVDIIYPAMLAIVIAAITYSEIFKQKSAHQTVLRHLDLGIRDSALSRLLHSTSVTRVMDYNVGSIDQHIDWEKAQSTIDNTLRWYVVSEDSKPLYLVKGQELIDELCKLGQAEYPCPLNDLGISNLSLSYLPMQATLQEALDIIKDSNTEAVLITGQQSHHGPAIRGVLNRADIEKHYHSNI